MTEESCYGFKVALQFSLPSLETLEVSYAADTRWKRTESWTSVSSLTALTESSCLFVSDHHEAEGFRGHGGSWTHSAVSSSAVLGKQSSSGKPSDFCLYVSVAVSSCSVMYVQRTLAQLDSAAISGSGKVARYLMLGRFKSFGS